MTGWELAALLVAWGLGGGSPGPATLTISGTAMARGQLICVSSIVFIGYGILFSNPWIVQRYRRALRAFELGFGVLFGAASFKILTAKIG